MSGMQQNYNPAIVKHSVLSINRCPNELDKRARYMHYYRWPFMTHLRFDVNNVFVPVGGQLEKTREENVER